MIHRNNINTERKIHSLGTVYFAILSQWETYLHRSLLFWHRIKHEYAVFLLFLTFVLLCIFKTSVTSVNQTKAKSVWSESGSTGAFTPETLQTGPDWKSKVCQCLLLDIIISTVSTTGLQRVSKVETCNGWEFPLDPTQIFTEQVGFTWTWVGASGQTKTYGVPSCASVKIRLV